MGVSVTTSFQFPSSLAEGAARCVLTAVGKLCASRLLVVVLTTIAVLGCQALLAGSASAETEGQAIVAAAQNIANQSYQYSGSGPIDSGSSFSSAKYIYCFDGGTTGGATAGGYDKLGTDGTYSNCQPPPNGIGRVGFDCRGLTLYAVFQGSGGAITLPTSTAGAQYSGASGYGGSYIALSALQPGDLVFFGSSSSAIDHVGIVVSGTGTSAEIISAVSEKWGIETHAISWFQAEFSWVGAVAIPGVGSTVGGGGGGPGSGYNAAFQANTGAMLDSYFNSSNQLTWTTNTSLGMAPGTSPSVAPAPNGGYDVALQANTGALLVSYLNSANQVVWTTNTGLGMMQGTSPSIAAGPNGSIGVALQANTGALLVSYLDASHNVDWTTNTGLGMMQGTSPSIALAASGGYDVALQANTGAMLASDLNSAYQVVWTTNTGLGMMQGTSPSIALAASGGYDVALQANTGAMLASDLNSAYQVVWTTNTGLGMMQGTSPSIAP